ncbi:hypothetical protein C8R46DRAFT_1215753 [Mycena filopes]|nr:hypothetical protein C8R46DRAFT_1215753 [Mycena filopes]
MIARSVSVMGPGSREDTIDDFCGFANWRKTVRLGNSLLRKMVLTIPKAMLHNRAFQAFTEGLLDGHEDELKRWEREVREWEQDHSKPCPYEYPEDEEPTMEAVRLLIAEEEHVRAEKGESLTNKPGAFIIAAMEIEGEQVAVRLEAKRRNRTSTQATDLQRKRTLLLGMVKRLRDEQAHFMPGLAALLESRTTTESNARPEEMALHLPSSFAQEAHTALRALRGTLRIRSLVHHWKRKHTSGQAAYTKSQALQSSIEVRIKRAAARYTAARAALFSIRGKGSWEDVLQPLQKADIRGMNERALNDEEKEEDRKAKILAGIAPDADVVDDFGDVVEPTVLFNLEVGEGTRGLSWIWYTGGTRDGVVDGELHDVDEGTSACGPLARGVLLEEEMRRALAFCAWKAKWWDEREALRHNISPELAEGIRAYAREQAARERKWGADWETKWAAVRARAAVCLTDRLVDVTTVVTLEVELEDDVAYGEYGADDEGEPDYDPVD